MKKQIIISSLLIILAIVLGLTGSVLATNKEIQPRTAEPANSIIQPRDNDMNNISNSNLNETNSNDQLYGTTIPQNEEEGVSLSEELKDIASTQQKDNRRAIVVTIVVITIVLIAGLVMWWYKTNY